MPSSLASRSHDQILAAFRKESWEDVTRLCQQVLRKSPKDLQATRMLGHALDQQGLTEESLKIYRRGAAYWPKDAELLINYGNVLLNHARNSEALPILEKVCALRPEKAICWLKLAECCYLLNRNDQGFQAAEKAHARATTAEEQSSSLTLRAIHRREMGQVTEAIADCEAAIVLSPNVPSNHTNRLLFLLADPRATAQRIAQAARDYAATLEPALRAQWPTFSSQTQGPWRKLRVGFLSPDFRVHSVMYFVEALLAQLDRRQFEVFAFYLFPRDDYVTPRVERHADHFVRLAHLKPPAQVQAIREREIDILIDLTGHTGHNGLLVMAHKAAPVQVSWLGFPATTGLEAMDYKFTDDVTDPPGAEDQYTERLYRLPTLFACYRPMSRKPLWRYQPRYLVRETPALTRGHITFGSCNNLGKLTDEVLTLWGKILQAVPRSRLLIEGKGLGDAETASRYRQRCAALGLNPEQLDLVGLSTDNQYLTYHDIDIALDPFPLTGGTTSFDALWMGVPLVSMKGDSFKSRMGTSVLTYLGRTAWLAQTPQQYVEIACALACDVVQLNATRQGLRQEMEQSALMDENTFVRFFAEALRVVWLQHLAQHTHPQEPAQQLAQMQAWLTDMPADWQTPGTARVGLEPGHAVSLSQAHALLEQALDNAKQRLHHARTADGQIHDEAWVALTELAEKVLCAAPHDPVALTCLAEVEIAHGHQEFAMTYLRHATQALAGTAPMSS